MDDVSLPGLANVLPSWRLGPGSGDGPPPGADHGGVFAVLRQLDLGTSVDIALPLWGIAEEFADPACHPCSPP